jgi:cobalt/nickel transport system permease protein
MSNAVAGLAQFGMLDDLARRDSPVHRIDPRAKLLVTLVFTVCVVSFNKYALSALLPFALYPVVLIAAAGLPVGGLLKRLLWVSPFAVLLGLFNPLLDRQALLTLGPLTLSGGMVSFLSILLRFLLTVSAALVLIATTGFESLTAAMQRLGVPVVFTTQLLLLYRYGYVLIDETARVLRARSLRSFGRRLEIAEMGPFIGRLLLRTLDRAERIHRAMACRGFSGAIHTTRRLRFGGADLLFLVGWSALFVLFRFVDIPNVIGTLLVNLI